MDKQQEYVLRAIEERDISFIRLWFTDVSGRLKSVAIAPAEVEGAFEENIGFDGSAIEGLTRVFAIKSDGTFLSTRPVQPSSNMSLAMMTSLGSGSMSDRLSSIVFGRSISLGV